MTEPITNFAATQALTLLTGYGFELKGYSASILIYKWLNHYQANWIRLAVVEALYQGRYKAISVEHILDGWQRRGQPNFHFSLEFERLICQNLFPRVTSDIPGLVEESVYVPELKEASVPVVPTVEGELVISEALVNPQEMVSKETENRRKIQQFTPLLDNSEMYAKLRAVARQQIMNYEL